MRSESTSALGQPRLIKPTLGLVDRTLDMLNLTGDAAGPDTKSERRVF
jgi:hypothetical protein